MKKYPRPDKAGFYWVRGRREDEAWRIVRIQGKAPYLSIRETASGAESSAVGNELLLDHMVTWGPEVKPDFDKEEL